MDNGFDEIIVKTKNRFYEMRSTLAQLRFDIIRFVQHPVDPASRRCSSASGSASTSSTATAAAGPSSGPISDPLDRVGGRSAARSLSSRRRSAAGFASRACSSPKAGWSSSGCSRSAGSRSIPSWSTAPRTTRWRPLLSAVATTGAGVRRRDPLTAITGYNFHRGCLALVHRPADSGAVGVLPAPPAARARGGRQSRQHRRPVPHRCGLRRGRRAARTPRAAIRCIARRSARRWARRSACRSRGPRTGGRRLPQFRERGFRVVALTPSAGAQTLSEFAATVASDERVMVMVGAEGPGLDAGTTRVADIRVRIPIDSAVDSLNVVVAAGIALTSRLSPRSGLPEGR